MSMPHELKMAIERVLAANEPLECYEDESDRDLLGALDHLREVYESVKERL